MIHTPGPWTVAADGDWSHRYSIEHPSVSPDEVDGNRSLVAAAPTLLDACKAVVEYFERVGTPTEVPLYAQVTLAVKEAEGR